YRTMTYARQRQKDAPPLKGEPVPRNQNDIGEIGASPSQKYIQEFTHEFQTFEAVVAPAEILEAARRANLIWIGDYHALTRSQTYASGFLRELKTRKNNIAVAVEPVFARNQEVLSRWMAGKISEIEFLDRIHYREEWGCDWEGY